MQKIMTRAEMQGFVEKLLASHAVYGVTEKDSKYAWDRIKAYKELVLDYNTTISSPKKYFLPPTETLLKFSMAAGDPKPCAVNEAESRVLFGMHACDVCATGLLDTAFEDTNRDLNYTEKRKKAVIIGVSCTPDPDCFCNRMGVDEKVFDSKAIASKKAMFDLFIVNLVHKYLVIVGTEAGEELLKKNAKCSDATPQDLENKAVIDRKRAESFTNNFKLNCEQLPKLLAKTYESPVWSEYADRCFACGTCNLVCPTCYCFNITEEVGLNLKEGARAREWDSCMLPQFAEVAGGENFREHVSQRLRHRLLRKGMYIKEKFNMTGCVGCGRCYRNCTADISITEMYNRLKEVSENE